MPSLRRTCGLEAFDPLHKSGLESPDRRVQVNLALSEAQGKAWLDISVHDTGKGVEIGAYDRMFEIFGSTKKEGTGLGLYMVKSSVESWRGVVTAGDSRIGCSGTSITIKLPISAGSSL